MTTLASMCHLIRSKNAGPFVLTFDLMFATRADYERAKRAQPLTPARLAALYQVPAELITLVYHDNALAIKASMPRPTVQGDPTDADCYGGQQYVPLLTIEVE
ncbi:MAG TPA: DUF4387 domain-containing protein [Gemmatimonadaceae bacterium]|jgi:hypothetical protein|nr:DUF4387 domain-containing protein [Gemmatimonadaceae bacterium]